MASLLFRNLVFFSLSHTLQTMKSNAHGIKQKVSFRCVQKWAVPKYLRNFLSHMLEPKYVCQKKRSENKHQNDLFNY